MKSYMRLVSTGPAMMPPTRNNNGALRRFGLFSSISRRPDPFRFREIFRDTGREIHDGVFRVHDFSGARRRRTTSKVAQGRRELSIANILCTNGKSTTISIFTLWHRKPGEPSWSTRCNARTRGPTPSPAAARVSLLMKRSGERQNLKALNETTIVYQHAPTTEESLREAARICCS